jgi:hypothetical protein
MSVQMSSSSVLPVLDVGAPVKGTAKGVAVVGSPVGRRGKGWNLCSRRSRRRCRLGGGPLVLGVGAAVFAVGAGVALVVGSMVLGVGAAVFAVGAGVALVVGSMVLGVGAGRFRRRSRCRRLGGGFAWSLEREQPCSP